MSQTKVQLIDGFDIDTSVPDNSLVIDSSGNVGIGTTSPSTLLHVAATGTSTNAEILIAGTNTNGDSSCQARIGATQDGALTSGALTFSTRLSGATSERARIDSSGRLLVGTSTSRNNSISSPQVQLEGVSTSASALSIFRNFVNTTNEAPAYLLLGRSGANSLGSNTVVANGNRLGEIRFMGADGSIQLPAARIFAEVDGTPGANDMPGRLVFATTADGASSPTERMRIAQDGRIFFDQARFDAGGGLWLTPSSFDRVVQRCGTSTTGEAALIEFINPNSLVGSITVNGSATAYNTSSDYRLKENVTPVTDGITRLQQLKPSRFNFIADPDKIVDGFLAHEVQSVVPEAITGEKDAVDDDGNPQYQGIDQSKLVPLLTAALQEAIGEIESLKARVAALESA